jgi:hypothetical protein
LTGSWKTPAIKTEESKLNTSELGPAPLRCGSIFQPPPGGYGAGLLILKQVLLNPRKWEAACTWVGIGARWLMTLTVVAVIFGVFAIGLIVLLIYKSTLTMHRDDQLFLDDASSHMHAEQTELLAKVNRLTIPVRVFSIGSGVFLLVLVAMWLYQKLNAVQ